MFITIGTARIKVDNILSYEETIDYCPYKKIYELNEPFFGGKTLVEWNGLTERISKERMEDIDAYPAVGQVNAVIKIAPGTKICTTYKKYKDRNGKICSLNDYPNDCNKNILTDMQDAYIMKAISVLEVTCVEGTYAFSEDEIDIRKKMAELDSLLLERQ